MRPEAEALPRPAQLAGPAELSPGQPWPLGAHWDGSGVNFAVRFRGFDNGGSEKAAGHLVPTPASLAVLGLAAVGIRRRR